MVTKTSVNLYSRNGKPFENFKHIEEAFNNIRPKLQKVLNTDDVACIIDAKHLCVNSRGIRDIESSTVTAEFGGKFKEEATKKEFIEYIKLDTNF